MLLYQVYVVHMHEPRIDELVGDLSQSVSEVRYSARGLRKRLMTWPIILVGQALPIIFDPRVQVAPRAARAGRR